MPDLYGPFDGASYSQSQWYRDAGTPSGVLGAAGASPAAGDLSLTASGFTLSMGLGRARVRGAAYERSGTAWTDVVPANASSVGPRIDRVVLRRDVVAKTVVPLRIQGTAAATPAPPALSRVENGAWDLPLYQVTVPASSGTPLVIADERVWAQVDRTIGERFLSTPSVLLLSGTPIWDTLGGGFPLTGVTDGGPVICRWELTAFNGASGADRTIDVRVICDGVMIGTGLTGMSIILAGAPRTPRVQTENHTPAAGLHTWHLQAKASAASSVYIETSRLIVIEKV